MSSISALCVYCGSSNGYVPEHRDAAVRLGHLLATARIRLVYGGANIGLMATIANAVLASGGAVTGVITEQFDRLGLTHPALTECIVTPDMHTRKAEMFQRSDGFVAMPGGIGTLEEVMEVLTWAHIGHHEHPVGLLNTAGFYDPLVQMLDQMVSAGFYQPEQRESLVVSSTPELLLASLGVARWPDVTKWVR